MDKRGPVAEAENPKRRPRIRKSAPTVRERAELAQADAQKPAKPKRVRGAAARVLRPAKKLSPRGRVRLPDNRFFRIVKKVGGWLVPRYFINSWREVRQVTWPARKETWRLTLAVFIFSTVFGVMVFTVDKGLDELFKKFVLK